MLHFWTWKPWRSKIQYRSHRKESMNTRSITHHQWKKQIHIYIYINISDLIDIHWNMWNLVSSHNGSSLKASRCIVMRPVPLPNSQLSHPSTPRLNRWKTWTKILSEKSLDLEWSMKNSKFHIFDSFVFYMLNFILQCYKPKNSVRKSEKENSEFSQGEYFMINCWLFFEPNISVQWQPSEMKHSHSPVHSPLEFNSDT